jgi:hypothetical protein
MAVVFKDAERREWDCSLTIAGIRRVAAGCNINIATIAVGDPPPLATLTTDPLALSVVLWHLLKGQADAHKVSEDQFYELLNGDTMAAAFNSFWEGVRLFFQRSGHGTNVAAINKQMEVLEAQHRAIVAATESVDAEALGRATEATARSEIARQMERATRGDSASSLPASSASTPAL